MTNWYPKAVTSAIRQGTLTKSLSFEWLKSGRRAFSAMVRSVTEVDTIPTYPQILKNLHDKTNILDEFGMGKNLHDTNHEKNLHS